MQKKCEVCFEYQDISEFVYKSGNRKSISRKCHDCRSEERRAYIKRRSTALKKSGIEKTCSRCKSNKHPSEFYMSSYSTDGFDNLCKECRKKSNKSSAETSKASVRDLRFKQKTELIQEMGGKCRSCGAIPGEVWPIDSFDFHHLSGKDFPIASLLGRSSASVVDRMIEEAKKCIILCANCHRMHHSSKPLL